MYRPYTPEDRKFYTTDAFTDRALQWLDEEQLEKQPFFLYLAYTAPHYPLHAWPEDIAKYKGKYDAGYQAVRQARYERMSAMGVIDPAKNPLPKWDGRDWDKLSDDERAKEIRRMEIYAAMLDRVDQNIGRLLAKLKAQGKLDNTMILFASDNGACAEGGGVKKTPTRLEDFGTVGSYETVGSSWATVQNTPLRKWKNHSEEGGIRTPLIVSWPGKIANPGGFSAEPGHFIDIMPTFIEITDASYPGDDAGSVHPLQGISLLPALDGKPLTRPQPLYWQWASGGAIREGNIKAVFSGTKKPWQLYDLSTDANESCDLADKHPEILKPLVEKWKIWMESVSNKP